MNITTNYPNVSLVTTNPATDSVVRDSVIRPVVPPVAPANASSAEPSVAGDKEKAQPNLPIIAAQNPTYEQPQNQIAGSSDTTEQQASQEEKEQQQEENQQPQDESADHSNERFSEKEQNKIDELKERHKEVVTHEQAHAGAGGQYAGSPSYSYETGPDGVKYAVSGEVSIDTAKIPNDPQATIVKAQQIKRAALAPAEPSAQDRRVAASADRLASEARQEILSSNSENSENGEDEANNYRINNAIESDSFKQKTELAQDESFQKTLVNRSQHINAFYQGSSQTTSEQSFYQQV